MNSLLSQNLSSHLKLISIESIFSQALEYTLLPAGKLFRPKLALALSLDLLPEHFPTEIELKKELLNARSALSFLCSFLEFHHAYTLVHDDLPCMDDDDFRRGRPSLHKKYNESIAVLAGDALLIGSLELLAKIPNAHPKMFSLICKLLGSRGLIYGQLLDMQTENEDKVSMARVLEIHYLKTGKLLQASLLLPLLAYNKISNQQFTKLFRLGKNLGLLFQLLDDLGEIAENKISTHEMKINPWLQRPEETKQVLEKISKKLSQDLSILSHTRKFCSSYVRSMEDNFTNNNSSFEKNCLELGINLSLKPIMTLLNTL